MTNESKLPYEKQSQEEQRKYEIAMAEWRKVINCYIFGMSLIVEMGDFPILL